VAVESTAVSLHLPVRGNPEGFAKAGHKIVQLRPFESTLVANPHRCQLTVKEIQRDGAHVGKRSLVDAWIEVRVEAGPHHAEAISGAESRQRKGLLYLFDLHAEVQAIKIVSGLKFVSFDSARRLWFGDEASTEDYRDEREQQSSVRDDYRCHSFG